MVVKKRAPKKIMNARRIRANEEIIDEVVAEDIEEPAEDIITVDPSATELVFEVDDVAELVAEITGEEVTVTADEDAVEFVVGEDVYTVEPDGDEEILETSRKVLRGKRPVSAARNLSKRSAARRSAKRR